METLYPTINPKLIEKITEAEEIAIFGHTNPDGDCVMSQLAVSYMLSSLGKKCHLFNQGPFNRSDINPYSLYFATEVPDELVKKNPLVIVVDCSTIDRPGLIFDKVSTLERIVFDHHSSGENFCKPEFSYIVPESVSTTLVLEQLRKALAIPLTYDLARFLYIGFCTDTGFYHFLRRSNAEESLRIVTEYVKEGVEPYEVFDTLNDGKTLDYYKEISTLVNRTIAIYDGQVLYTYQNHQEALADSVSDVLYSQLLTVKGVKVVFFFKEKEDCIVVGMRSKKDSKVDVGSFAQSFGGGGHFFASGASLKKTLAESITLVTTVIKDLLDTNEIES